MRVDADGTVHLEVRQWVKDLVRGHELHAETPDRKSIRVFNQKRAKPPKLPNFTPRSLPPPRIAPLPQDMAVREHFRKLRAEKLREAADERASMRVLALKQKAIAGQGRRDEIRKALYVVLGDATLADVARSTRLTRATVWRILMGRMEPGLTVYLRICRAIQRLNPGVMRVTIDRYLVRVLRRPLP